MVKSIDKSRDREYYMLNVISERNECIMELPNNTHSSEAVKQMEFAEGFNPELTNEEKLQAAAEFDDLVQSTLLRFAGDAKTYDHDIILSDGIQSKVSLEIPQKDRSCVLVSVKSALLDSGDKERSISITELDGRDKETHDYYIEDDQVLRYDGNVAERSRKLGGVLRLESISIEGIKRALDVCRNEMENSKLEQQMGLNRQPVGVDEINKLAELLESDEIKVFKVV